MCTAHYGCICFGQILPSQSLADQGLKSVFHNFSVFNSLLTGWFVGLCGLFCRPELEDQLLNSSGFPGLQTFLLTCPNFSCEPSSQLLKKHRKKDKILLFFASKHRTSGLKLPGLEYFKGFSRKQKIPWQKKILFLPQTLPTQPTEHHHHCKDPFSLFNNKPWRDFYNMFLGLPRTHVFISIWICFI